MWFDLGLAFYYLVSVCFHYCFHFFCLPVDGINEMFPITFVVYHSALSLWLLMEKVSGGFLIAGLVCVHAKSLPSC